MKKFVALVLAHPPGAGGGFRRAMITHFRMIMAVKHVRMKTHGGATSKVAGGAEWVRGWGWG